LLDTEGINLITNLKICFAAVTPHFSFFPCLCGGKTHCKRKTADKRFFKDTGVVLAEHNDRLPPAAD
jgi:hypothetical protein